MILKISSPQDIDTAKYYRIGDVIRLLGLSADTLRYYEKIGLLPPVNRTPSGIRIYNKQDLSRLRFIKRAQKMRFTLAEIGMLMNMRTNPQHARDEVRQLTANKLAEVELNLAEIQVLRDELRLLLNLCRGSEDGCPIIETIDEDITPAKS
ncbi:MAG: heavy metal-responsive transcriptional regulator [Gammaproteobacteria bacterium]|nr:heavy metal-responsive transcriptional regulator [Gammaproteobacteria bacterium]